MAQITTFEDVERWLSGASCTREQIIVFAARAALRALPALASELHRRSGQRSRLPALVLPVFRAAAAPWVASQFQGQGAALISAAADAAEVAIDSGAVVAASAAARTADRVDPSAAYAAAAVYAAEAAVKDASLLRGGSAPSDVAGLPLWHGHDPDWTRELWARLRKTLNDVEQEWDVWVYWYERRLAGAPLGLHLERAWLELTVDDWKHGPAHANRKLKEIVDRLERIDLDGGEEEQLAAEIPEVPPQRPAALEPFWSGSILTLPKVPAFAQCDEETMKAALHALKDIGNRLANDAEAAADISNFDQRTVAYLKQVVESMPKEVPEQQALFVVAHEHQVLVGLQGVVREEWPSVLAARYHSFVLQFERTIRQFPKWQEFTRNALDQRVVPMRTEDDTNAVDAVVHELSTLEGRAFVDRIIPEKLLAFIEWVKRETAAAAQNAEAVGGSVELLVQDLLESLNNVLKRIAEEVLAVAGGYGRDVWTGAKKQLADSAESDGRRLVKWGKRLFVATAAGGLGSLALAHPEHFSWLKFVIDFLKTAG